jgi:RimJ/RimL family protein N-acetyltransferase
MSQSYIVQSERIALRESTESDLDFVIAHEQESANLEFIHYYSEEKHRECIADPDCGHWIIENVEEKQPVGYLILFGLENRNKAIEFRRVVVTEKGHGFGRATLKLIKRHVFEELKFNRLWLDVMEKNVRARHLYKTEGFVEEGMMREAFFKDGNYVSLMLMSMLSREYLAIA